MMGRATGVSLINLPIFLFFQDPLLCMKSSIIFMNGVYPVTIVTIELMKAIIPIMKVINFTIMLFEKL